jgi:hypothetical protein
VAEAGRNGADPTGFYFNNDSMIRTVQNLTSCRKAVFMAA